MVCRVFSFEESCESRLNLIENVSIASQLEMVVSSISHYTERFSVAVLAVVALFSFDTILIFDCYASISRT